LGQSSTWPTLDDAAIISTHFRSICIEVVMELIFEPRDQRISMAQRIRNQLLPKPWI
jgi:hypothetical protein